VAEQGARLVLLPRTAAGLVRRMRSFRQVSWRPGPFGPAGGLAHRSGYRRCRHRVLAPYPGGCRRALRGA